MQYFAYSQKAFVYKYVVMLSDIDQFQHMSFANYLKLMFLSTDALFVSCLDNEFLSKNRLKLVRTKMQFKRQSVAGDNILVKLNSSESCRNQFSLLYTFVIEGTGELVALGRQTYEITKLHSQSDNDLPGNIKNILQPIFVDEQHLIYKY